MKKPPEEKEPVDNTPIVEIRTINMQPLTLTVDSYGVVQPKYETQLVAQVTGQIVELSEAFVSGGFVKKGQFRLFIGYSIMLLHFSLYSFENIRLWEVGEGRGYFTFPWLTLNLIAVAVIASGIQEWVFDENGKVLDSKSKKLLNLEKSSF